MIIPAMAATLATFATAAVVSYSLTRFANRRQMQRHQLTVKMDDKDHDASYQPLIRWKQLHVIIHYPANAPPCS
jgi:uncharacterized OsmC-like protein